jgi:hypothetical protein
MHSWIPYLCALAAKLVAECASSAREYNDVNTAEGWAWQQIRNGEIADLARRTPPGSSTRCGPLDPKKPDPDDHCHLIFARFVVDVLSDPKLQAQLDRHGFRLRNARIAACSSGTGMSGGAFLSPSARGPTL